MATFSLAPDVVFGESAPREQWHLHSGEILRRDPRLLGLHVFVFTLVVADDSDVAAIVFARKVRIIGGRHDADAGQCRQ